MGMELGIDKEQIEAFKKLIEKSSRDPVSLRFLVAAAIVAIGLFALTRPLSRRLDEARALHVEAQNRSATAQEIRHLVDQIEIYEQRITSVTDVVDWQNYVLDKLQLSGAMLRGIEPKDTTGKGVFKIVEISLTAQGSYEQLADFVDLMERGERVVRLDRVYIERLKTVADLECVIKGLVKPRLLTAGRRRPDG